MEGFDWSTLTEGIVPIAAMVATFVVGMLVGKLRVIVQKTENKIDDAIYNAVRDVIVKEPSIPTNPPTPE